MSRNPPAVNAVYYPSWSVYHDRPPSTLRVDSITHVFYRFASPNEDGSLSTDNVWLDDQMPVNGERGCLRALAKLKRQHPHLTTILSVGGPGKRSSGFPGISARAMTRVTFAASVREFVDKYSLDGVDISWEYPVGPSEGANFINLLQMLRTYLPGPRYLLTAALPIVPDCFANINLAAAGFVLDYFNLMAYNNTGSWSSGAGHHAQLLPPPTCAPGATEPTPSCHSGVDYLVRCGFPKRKIILGVPTFAKCFLEASAVGDPFDQDKCTEMRYRDLPLELVSNPMIDDKAVAAWGVGICEGAPRFASFDVPATVLQKAEYVRSMGLAGLFFSSELNDIHGPNSLVVAGQKGLGRL